VCVCVCVRAPVLCVRCALVQRAKHAAEALIARHSVLYRGRCRRRARQQQLLLHVAVGGAAAAAPVAAAAAGGVGRDDAVRRQQAANARVCHASEHELHAHAPQHHGER
jgi:hypothetical protein